MTHIKSEFKKDITNSCPVHARWPRNQKLFILFRFFVILIINSLLVLMLRPQFQIGFAIKFRFIKESHVNTAHVRTANQNPFNKTKSRAQVRTANQNPFNKTESRAHGRTANQNPCNKTESRAHGRTANQNLLEAEAEHQIRRFK